MYELLSIKQKYEADAFAEAHGVSSLTLMENAGQACCTQLQERCSGIRRICVLCGSGGNGGDGFVIAKILADQGHIVQVGLLCPVQRLQGDTAIMASRWAGNIFPISEAICNDAEIIVDAIFGIGLSRPIEKPLALLIDSLNKRRDCWVMSVDVPSGLDGNSGALYGTAIRADLTVTFFRKVAGHLLLPGKAHCGEVVVADIGISRDVLNNASVSRENSPSLWRHVFPVPSVSDHKYSRGHAVIVSGGPISTGAARLAARGALRVGAGLVTLASPSPALAVNAAHLTAIMLTRVDTAEDIRNFLSDTRRNAVLLGPGNGVGEEIRSKCLAVLENDAACVMDADALTCFSDTALSLFTAIKNRPQRTVVLTPHEGEFKRLFPDAAQKENKIERAAISARISGAIIILKGSDTVIAAPDGRIIINDNAPATLATAGSGDVLGGIVCGLLAQGMDGFNAACAAVWLHGAAAQRAGISMIAEDLPEKIPPVLQDLFPYKKHSNQ